MNQPNEPLPSDAHLRAALRHAPDAELAAPPHLGAQIVAAAHRAAAEAAPAAPAPRRRWAPWRLGASGAFASVLLGGVIGVLWQGEKPGPAVETPASVVAENTPPATRPAEAPSAMSPSTPTPEPAPATANKAAAPAPTATARLRALPAPAPGTAPAPAPIEAVRQEAAVASAAPLPALVAAPTTPPAPTPTRAPLSSLPPAAAAPALALFPRTADSAARQAAPAAAMMAAPRPTAPWMAAVAAGAAVQWQVDGQARTPSSSWFHAIAAQSQGRWRSAQAAPRAGEREVTASSGGALLGRMFLGPERVLWCDAQGRCEEAALAADVAATLSQTLDIGATTPPAAPPR